MPKAYTSVSIPMWVEYWLDLHTDAQHEEPRAQCAECQRMIDIHGNMPPKRWMLDAYEALKRPKFKYPIPARLRRAVLERDNYTCRHCGSHEDLAADHIIPEIKNGPTTLDNLQTLCRSCNSRKGDK